MGEIIFYKKGTKRKLIWDVKNPNEQLFLYLKDISTEI